MSKIICDVCGTRYPDSAEQCPICGCVHTFASEQPNEAETIMEEEFVVSAGKAERGGHFSKANVRKRNRNQPAYEEVEMAAAAVPVLEKNEEDPFEEFEEANSRGGAVLNVLLVIVILALLAVSSYIFLKFFMPNFMDKQEPTAPAVVETLAPTEEATEEVTEEATEEVTEAPTEDSNATCEQLSIEVTDITLNEPGAMFLLNVQVLPENTTDPIMYISSNEDVATVNEEGRVTAVSEGTVVISIFCGEQQTECNVICNFATETEAPAEEETEAPTEAPGEKLKDVTLGVKTADLTFRSGGQQATIKLTCKLDNDEVTWTSADEAIATVDKDGIITRVGAGTTTITGTYGEQTVEIIVRCPRK